MVSETPAAFSGEIAAQELSQHEPLPPRKKGREPVAVTYVARVGDASLAVVGEGAKACKDGLSALLSPPEDSSASPS